MADVPKDLLAQIKSLEEQFTVPKETLDKIVTKFVKELEKGLAKEGSTIPMNPTWCMGFPHWSRDRYLPRPRHGRHQPPCL